MVGPVDMSVFVPELKHILEKQIGLPLGSPTHTVSDRMSVYQ